MNVRSAFLSIAACCLPVGAIAACNNDARPNAASSASTTDAASSGNKRPGNKRQPGELPTRKNAKAKMKLMEVPDAKAKHALCNDGSPAKFYARPGTAKDKGKWIVHLQGGGACSSEAECKERERHLTTNKRRPKHKAPQGLLDTNPKLNPDFHGYTHVFVPYCSSDMWMGNSAAGDNSLSWHFRGKNIVAAVIDKLKEHGLDKAEQLLFTGCSAGAAGMRHNLDDVAAMLPGVPVRGISDAAFSPRIPELLEKFKGNGQAGIDLWKPKPDASCTAAEDVFTCLNGPHVAANHMTTPLFVRMAQRDRNTFKRFGIARDSPEGDVFAEGVRKAVGKGDGGFAPATQKHCTITGGDFNSEKIDGKSFRETVGNWVLGRSGPKLLIER